MKLKVNAFLLLSLFLASCSSNPYKLTDDGRKVEIKLNRPKDCEVIGRVSGESSDGEFEAAKNMARNQAASKGADALYINDQVQNGAVVKVLGTAYKCR